MKRLIIAAALMAVSADAMAESFQCSGHGYSTQVETTYSGLSMIKLNGVYVKPAQGALRNSNGTNQQMYESAYPLIDGNKIYSITYSDNGDIYNIVDNTSDYAAGKTHWSAEELKAKIEICPAWTAHVEADKQQREDAARAQQTAKEEAKEKAQLKAILKHAADEAAKQQAKEEASKTW